MDRWNPSFWPVHGACDSIWHPSVVTDEEEEKLWTSGVFSIDNPKNLQRAVFYYVGKRFCFRGG